MNKYHVAFALFAGLQSIFSAQSSAVPAARARTQFQFEIDLPYEEAFPLFGAWGERSWAPDWNPQFLYPNPPADVAGAVFLVERGPSHASVWIATQFDLATGKVQYVNVLNQAVITRIDLQVTRKGERRSSVAVTYERTALNPAASHIDSLKQHDEAAGAEWKAAIDAYVMRKAGKSR